MWCRCIIWNILTQNLVFLYSVFFTLRRVCVCYLFYFNLHMLSLFIIADVPWCLVDGVVLENTNALQKAVCDAYTGTPPASCKAALEEATLICKNN